MALAAGMLVLGFLLGVLGSELARKRSAHLPRAIEQEHDAPTYEDMKRNIAITDADWIMRIGAA